MKFNWIKKEHTNLVNSWDFNMGSYKSVYYETNIAGLYNGKVYINEKLELGDLISAVVIIGSVIHFHKHERMNDKIGLEEWNLSAALTSVENYIFNLVKELNIKEDETISRKITDYTLNEGVNNGF